MMKDARMETSEWTFRELIKHKGLAIHYIATRFQYSDENEYWFNIPSPQYVATAKRYYLATMKERFPIRWRFRVMKNAYAERMRIALISRKF